MQFENFTCRFHNSLITEILKEKLHGSGIFELYYYRDTNKNEINLLIEKAARLHLVEIKMRKNIDKADARIVENFTAPDKKLICPWAVANATPGCAQGVTTNFIFRRRVYCPSPRTNCP
jgi:hypothetical protein